jgi:hypothetical protein
MGVLEEGGKAVSGVVDAMRPQPLVLAMGLMNIALLIFLFYYLSRITTRTETTAAQLFTANDKLFSQWADVVNDTHRMMEKSQHCIMPDDAMKLLNAGIATYGISPIGRLAPIPPIEPVEPARPSEPKP